LWTGRTLWTRRASRTGRAYKTLRTGRTGWAGYGDLSIDVSLVGSVVSILRGRNVLDALASSIPHASSVREDTTTSNVVCFLDSIKELIERGIEHTSSDVTTVGVDHLSRGNARDTLNTKRVTDCQRS
jgi:hypothetical protein